jgi:hypothetical protein
LCWQTVEQQFIPALAIASAVGNNCKKTTYPNYYAKNILPLQYESHLNMTTIALKKLLINRIAEINDVSFLNAIKTILDTKTQTQTLSLTPEQRFEIIESQKEIESGLFVEQVELDKEFNKWLSGK